MSTRSLRFTAAMDWWVAALFFICLALLALSIPLAIWKGEGILMPLLTSFILIALFLLVADRALFTAYELGPEALVLSGQLRRIEIPYRNIAGIKEGGLLGLVSFWGRRRFALSADCLVISLQGYEWKQITVSPQERERFLEELHKRIAKSKVAANGLRRHHHSA